MLGIATGNSQAADYLCKRGAYLRKRGGYLCKRGAYLCKRGGYLYKRGAYLCKHGGYLYKNADRKVECASDGG